MAEDNALIAIDLADALEELGAKVLGPATRVKDGLDLLNANMVDGAILDVDLLDGLVTPIAKSLIAKNVPVIFCTGTQIPEALKASHPGLPVHYKPCPTDTLANQLADLLDALDRPRA